jgi:hypothetical protein
VVVDSEVKNHFSEAIETIETEIGIGTETGEI